MSDFSDVQKKSANSCLLSIVIPAYNVEKYVRQCIDSVLNIVPNDGTVEIIIVNDGSTDTTREILTEYNSEKCVRVFNNDNFGVSAARNFAIEQAKGKYIGFLDADDYWQSVSWSNLFNFLQSDSHIIEFNAIRVNEQGEFIDELNVVCSENTTITIIDEALLNQIAVICKWYPWSRFFRRDIWGKHRFPVGKIYEDLMTLPVVYNDARNLLPTNVSLVCYRVNSSSITCSPNFKRVVDLFVAADLFADLAKSSFDFYAICSRNSYSMAVRTAASLPANNLDMRFFSMLAVCRKKMWRLIFTSDFRYLRYFLFPKSCFNNIHRKSIRKIKRREKML